MLSIENPPPDPSCSCQFPKLITTSSDEPKVDLPNPPLDHHTPLPNFSIRDYVFTARSKDIKKNWPFSLKNLQLCLKHGVKDVLPPFQLLDTAKNLSFKTCTVESCSLEKENTSNFDKEPSRQEKHVLLDSSDDPQLNNKLAESCVDISSCRSGEENDFPSTTTSVSQSEIEYPSTKTEIKSLPHNRQSSAPTETCRKATVAVEAAVPCGNKKTESNSRSVGKKCRLIVKFGGNSDRNSTEDIASNSTTISETMASKVCPVCKTFSSTSNTTLNAHIDQCLSVESTPKWTADSKLTRPRIKPRKTRLMVDIYCTARPCTLEELDRRNGTSWATVSSLPTQENDKTENNNEGKKQRVSMNYPEDVGDVGPVYIDANGTKLRILSKLNDQSSVSKVGEDIGTRKLLKGDKGIKYISNKKKKRLAEKHQKCLKLAPQSKKIFSHKAHGSQISRDQEECPEEAKNSEKHHWMSKQSKPSDSGTLRPWVCSKRRGFTKKIASQEGHQPVRCNWHLPRDLLVDNGQSFLGNSLAERTHVEKLNYLSENPVSSSRNSVRTDKSIHKLQISNRREQSPGCKKVGNLLEARTSNNPESSSPPMKQIPNQLGSCGTSVYNSCMLQPSKSTRNHASLLKKKTIDTHGDSINASDISCIASSKSSRSAHAIVTKAMKFSSFRRNISVNSQPSGAESMPGKLKKWAALKKSQVRSMKKRDEVLTWHSEVDQQYEIMHDDADNQVEREEMAEKDSLNRITVLQTRQATLCFSHEEEALALRSSRSATHCYDDDMQVDADSSVRIGDDFLQTIDCLDSARKQAHVYAENIVVEPSSKTSDGRSTTSLVKPVDSEFYKLDNSLKVQSNYRGLFCGTEAPADPTEPDFVNDKEMFSADEVGNDMARQHAEMGVELDSEAEQRNSFAEVDPIPIPGPPGSFLPSPRDMGSEDFQGNSSLTTSRVHSSPDQHDVVDGDSSDSPMSAASTISNPSAGFKYSEPSSSLGPYAAQDRIRSTIATAEPSVQSAGVIPQATSTDMERTSFSGEYLKLDRIYIEKGSFAYKNDQPCCCQRKERFNQGVTLNYQESQLLRRRKMASMTGPASGKQMDFNSNLRLADMDVRPELAVPSNCPNSGSEKVVLPVTKPLASPIPFKDSPNTGVRPLARNDSDSASPSASNPVLRLMGKNLMVVNKDEDAPVPLGGIQPHVQNNHHTPQFADFSRPFPGNIQNWECHPLHPTGPQVPVIFGQNSHKVAGQCFDGGLSNSFRSQFDSSVPLHVRLPAGIFQDQHTDYGLATTSMDYHDYNVPSRHNRLKNRLNSSSMDNMEKVIATPDRHCQHSDSSVNPVKEIIIIDDIPESENIVISDGAKYAQGRRESQISYNLNRVHPYNCYQSQEHTPIGKSPMVHGASLHVTPIKPGNTCPIRWGCISEDSGVLQRSPFPAASSSPGHLRSPALHYSPGFS
ncbi:uncharacterized protein LOC8267943 [Ricinus communis]|uniref:uncharacterized protein LOC8267943 n=1 Tax=Ricinus communis TaxID=3988 RepID=UPI00201A7993|nr:uncharacterized protein LOC8267943 [Ricinus communis]XP_048227531.1 uncharacterized protein LOC8267943 [Ricinus communis]XP_048227536.1 uncharacterized protein LOC8267943 [Ricinus communis]